MSRQHNRLTPHAVKTLRAPGHHADGGNLYLNISKTASGGLSRRWAFKYAIDGHEREAGFGPVADVPLADARAKAAEWRALVRKGIDPLDSKQAAKTVNEAGPEALAIVMLDIALRRRRADFEATAGRLLDGAIANPNSDLARELRRLGVPAPPPKLLPLMLPERPAAARNSRISL